MTAWKTTGIIATLAIIFTFPLYVAVEKRQKAVQATLTQTAVPAFVGSDKCRDCHKPEFDKWKGSHHERAMDTATEETVLGDFNNAVFEHAGVTSKFYRKNEGFLLTS